MEYLTEFVEANCTIKNGLSVLSSYFWDQYKSYLRVKHPQISTNFSNKIFTAWIEKLYPKLGRSRNEKGKLFLGICMTKDSKNFKIKNNYDNVEPEDKKKMYNKNHYVNNREKIKKKAKIHRQNEKEIRDNYMRLARLDSSSRSGNVMYETRKEKGLIIIVNNDDGSINWDETMKQSNEAVRKHQIDEANEKRLARGNNHEEIDIDELEPKSNGKEEIEEIDELESNDKKEIDEPQPNKVGIIKLQLKPANSKLNDREETTNSTHQHTKSRGNNRLRAQKISLPTTLKYIPAPTDQEYLPFDRGYESIVKVRLTLTDDITKADFDRRYNEKAGKINWYIHMLENVRDFPQKFDPKDIAGVDTSKEIATLEDSLGVLEHDWREARKNWKHASND